MSNWTDLLKTFGKRPQFVGKPLGVVMKAASNSPEWKAIKANANASVDSVQSALSRKKPRKNSRKSRKNRTFRRK